MSDYIEGQMSIFDFIDVPRNCKEISINNPIRIIEMFAGYGSQSMALERLGADFEHWFVCEFDKYAVKSYNAVHGTDFETKDIRDVKGVDLNITDIEHFTYLLTYSFPCTDLSVAGKQAGMSRDSGTRSGLLWEVERILKELISENRALPQILFMENVPQVHGKNAMADFQEWIDFLSSIGYTSVYKDLNAKNYGVAQNRNRTFMFSFLNDFAQAEDYEFPIEIPLESRLIDYLDDEVPENMYIKTEKAENLLRQLVDNGTIAKTIYRAEQSRAEQSRAEQSRVVVDGTINQPREKQVANCIKARYNAGIVNARSDGTMVAEISRY